MTGFVQDIEGLAVTNTEIRRVSHADALPARPDGAERQDRSAEVHTLDQFFAWRRAPVRRSSMASGRQPAGFAVVVCGSVTHHQHGPCALKLYTALRIAEAIGMVSSTTPAPTRRAN